MRTPMRTLAVSALLVISLFFNLYTLIKNATFEPKDFWRARTTEDGLLEVMKYVEVERELEGVVRSEFVSRTWQCIKNDIRLRINGMDTSRAASSYHQQLPDLKNIADDLTQNGAGGRLLTQNVDDDSSVVRSQFQQRFGGDGNGDPSIHPSSTRSSIDTKKSFLSLPVANNFAFSYIHDQADACAQGNVDVIFASPSAPGNFERRMNMRRGAFGNFTRDPRNRARLLFFIGRPQDSTISSSDNTTEDASVIQDRIQSEQDKYNDIVQATFADYYKNINYKGLLIPKWCSDFCPQSEFVIRVDDDVSVVSIPDLITALKTAAETHDHFVLGLLRNAELPARKRLSKYFSSVEDFPYRVFPPYVLGGCMAYPVATGRLIYEACRRVRPVFWIDDVWVTGVCAKKVAVPVMDHPAFHFKHGKEWAH